MVRENRKLNHFQFIYALWSIYAFKLHRFSVSRINFYATHRAKMKERESRCSVVSNFCAHNTEENAKQMNWFYDQILWFTLSIFISTMTDRANAWPSGTRANQNYSMNDFATEKCMVFVHTSETADRQTASQSKCVENKRWKARIAERTFSHANKNTCFHESNKNLNRKRNSKINVKEFARSARTKYSRNPCVCCVLLRSLSL